MAFLNHVNGTLTRALPPWHLLLQRGVCSSVRFSSTSNNPGHSFLRSCSCCLTRSTKSTVTKPADQLSFGNAFLHHQTSILLDRRTTVVNYQNQVISSQRAHFFGGGGKNDDKIEKLDYLYSNASTHSKQRWPLQQVVVETCGNLYEDDPYSVKLCVAYVDTDPCKDEKCPTVLMVHGSPGSHYDFLPIIDSIAEKGIRVIAPNMPGFGFTKGLTKLDDDAYVHSCDENSEFLLDFLAEIGVGKVDLIIGHCTGSSAALNVLSKSNKAKALVAICPIANDPRCIEPYLFVQSLARNQNSFFWKNTVKRYLRNKVMQYGISAKDQRHLMSGLLAISHSQFNDLGSFAASVGMKGIPVLAIYTKDDRLISCEKCEEFLELLGVDQKRVAECSENGVVFSAGQKFSDGYSKGLKLETGGHYPHVKYPYLFAREILKFMEHLSDKDFNL